MKIFSKNKYKKIEHLLNENHEFPDGTVTNRTFFDYLTNALNKSIMVTGSFFVRIFKKILPERLKAFLINPRSDKEHKAHWAKERGMKKFNSRAFGTIAILVIAAALSACGGGGGGGSDAPAPANPAPVAPAPANPAPVAPAPVADTTAPQLTLATASPASLTTTITVSANEDLGGNVSIVVRNGGATIPGSTTLSQGNRSMVWTPAGKLPANATLSISASASDLSGNVGTASMTLTTGADASNPLAWWTGAKVFPVGEKVVGVNELPGSAQLIGDDAWKKAVMDGVVKVVDTGATMTGFTTRPIVWTMFKRGVGYCTVPVYKDDGGAIGTLTSPGSMCNSEAFDFSVGTSTGLIRHFTARNQCYEWRWNTAAVRFDDQQVTCP